MNANVMVLTTLLLTGWEEEDNGLDPNLNLALWLVWDLDAQRGHQGIPSVFG